MMIPLRSLLAVVAAISCLSGGSAFAQNGPASQVLPEGIHGGSEVVPQAGVQLRKYLFKPTNEELPYSVFVSSKVKPGQKAPLIIALRGFTGTPLTFVRGTAVELAEKGGYILVGPIGYNNRSGFGTTPRPRPAPTAASTPAAPSPPPSPQPPMVGGTSETDAAKASAYSEQDVMNVLALVRNEFAIDDRRIYLMGHSQGGGGARHLYEKYPDIWAGVALLAPAIFGDASETDGKAPLLVAVGDKDGLLPRIRQFHAQLETLKIPHEFVEKPGLDHGQIIMSAMPEVFGFFAKHVKTK